MESLTMSPWHFQTSTGVSGRPIFFANTSSMFYKKGRDLSTLDIVHLIGMSKEQRLRVLSQLILKPDISTLRQSELRESGAFVLADCVNLPYAPRNLLKTKIQAKPDFDP